MNHPTLDLPSLDRFQKLCLGNLRGDNLALVASELVSTHKKPILLVTPDNRSALYLKKCFHFFAPGVKILHFPDWGTLPYDPFSPHSELVAQRLISLTQLPHLSHGILIIAVTTLMQRLAPTQYVQAHSFCFSVGEKWDRDKIRQQLEQVGYQIVSQVIAPGDYAIRGAILDLFPLGSLTPYRLELGENEVESIRQFDPTHQQPQKSLKNLTILPTREFPLTPPGIENFRKKWQELFGIRSQHSPLYRTLSHTTYSAGVEYYLPLFFSKTSVLFDYFPSSGFFILMESLQEQAEHFWHEISQRYEQRQSNLERPPLPPETLYLTPHEILTHLHRVPRIELHVNSLKKRANSYNIPSNILPDLRINPRSTHSLEKLQNFLQGFLSKKENRVLFCAETPGRREGLLTLLNKIPLLPKTIASWQDFYQTSEKCCITISPLDQGLLLNNPSLLVITENQLLGHPLEIQPSTKTQSPIQEAQKGLVRDLAELNLGAAVVHRDHGIGRYQGLQILKVLNYEAEFLVLEYADKAKLYTSISELHLISCYHNQPNEEVPLHHLGSDQWQKARRQAREQIRDIASELLDSHAQRAARKGYAFNPPNDEYQQFAQAFPFEETKDQRKAIHAVIKDMCSDKSMDRLICGDAGFGKTEIGMRAAFLALQSGKQVAVFVPTTLLAQQHYRSFTDRFSSWSTSIEMISRFQSANEQKAILDKLKLGVIPIVIGTHKLLSKRVVFKDLGLLIIDEEHRFGVQQKEYLKQLQVGVDTLMMTATPIPRTLSMALSDLHSLSIIASPPAERLPVKTFIHEYNNTIIREAILRELLRGGQVYFLYNDIETIEKTAEKLKVLVPEAQLGIAHGQMKKHELEQIMTDFYHQRFSVLVCTTIIETGLDIPTANTIIITRADQFGLAQLYQLRGRVGRSHHQAYTYCMTPPKETLSTDANKRLSALASLEGLGVGFMLATHDLEIRGTGELLGEKQSGHIHTIGLSLYMEMLEQAIQALKSGQEPNFDQIPVTEINVHISAIIPKDYIIDVATRLSFYKRIASAIDIKQLQQIQIELIDQFGLLPQMTKNLFRIAEMKLFVQKLGINKIEAGPSGGQVEFKENPQINTQRLIEIIKKQPDIYRFDGPHRLRFTWTITDSTQRIDKLECFLNQLIS